MSTTGELATAPKESEAKGQSTTFAQPRQEEKNELDGGFLSRAFGGAPGEQPSDGAIRVLRSPTLSHPANTGLQAISLKSAQQSHGNRFTQHAVAQIQRKPMPARLLQPQRSCGGTCAASQDKVVAEGGSELLQRQTAPAGTAEALVDASIVPSHSIGQPLDRNTRSFMEPRFGNDFSDVRVHTDSRAAQSAEMLQADAYATGRDIYFAAGKYAPETTSGQRLLAHELAHTIQQQGPALKSAPTAQLRVSQSIDPLEVEADRAADHAVHGDGSMALHLSRFTGTNLQTVAQRQEATGTDAFPNLESQHRKEKEALTKAGLTDPTNKIAGVAQSETRFDGGATARYKMAVSASGSEGKIQSCTTVILDYEPNRKTEIVGSPTFRGVDPELALRPIDNRPAYPYTLSYSRTITYSDKEGRTASVEVKGFVFFSEKTIADHLKLSGPVQPSYNALLNAMGDGGSMTVTIQGTGPVTAYLANHSGGGNSLKIQSEAAELGLAGGDGLSFITVSEKATFVDPQLTAGDQYSSLRRYLLSADAAELARQQVATSAGGEAETQSWVIPDWLDRLLISLEGSINGDLIPFFSFFDSVNEAMAEWWAELSPRDRALLKAIGGFAAGIALMVALAAVVVGLSLGEIEFAAAMALVGAVMLAISYRDSLRARISEAWNSDNRWLVLLAPLIAVYDVIGVSGIIEASTDQSMLTSAPLGRSEEERWEAGATGALQLIGIFFMVRGLRSPRGVTVTPEVRGNMADFNALPLEKLTTLPEGHYWLKEGVDWTIWRETTAPEIPLEIEIFSDGKGDVNLVTREGLPELQGEVKTQSSDNIHKEGDSHLSAELAKELMAPDEQVRLSDEAGKAYETEKPKMTGDDLEAQITEAKKSTSKNPEDVVKPDEAGKPKNDADDLSKEPTTVKDAEKAEFTEAVAAAKPLAKQQAQNVSKKFDFSNDLDAASAVEGKWHETFADEYVRQRKGGADKNSAREAARKMANSEAIKIARTRAIEAARARARADIETNTAFKDDADLGTDFANAKKAYDAGTHGQTAKSLSPQLVGKTISEIAGTLDADAAAGMCKKSLSTLGNGKSQGSYQYPDGTLVRIKPNGDAFSSDPMYSVEVTKHAGKTSMGQDDIAFKVAADGKPVPKGPSDLKNPYNNATHSEQHRAYKDEAMQAGHLRAKLPAP